MEPILFLYGSPVVQVPRFILEHFNLLVDVKGPKVVHADYPEDVVIHASPGSQPAFKSVSFLSALQKIQELLEKYPDVLFSDVFSALKPSHGVRCHLLDLLSSRSLEYLIQRSMLQLRKNSPPWRKQGSFEDPPLPGLLFFIW